MAWALGYVHGRGVIHRDVKPDNVLIDSGSGRALVTDFGIARVQSQATASGRGEILGTLRVMSPEQAGGDDTPVDGRSDLYSLGVTAFFALTGRPPFEASNPAALVAMHLSEPAQIVAMWLIWISTAEVAQRIATKAPGLIGDPLDPLLAVLALGNSSQTSCGLTSAGAARCWGYNVFGQIGDGTTTNRSSPTTVSGGLTFTTMTVGGTQACGLTSAGAAHCWGYNSVGGLGDGTTTNRLTPVVVSGGLTFSSVWAGQYHTCALVAGGAPYCWGNSYGTLGILTVPTAVVP